MITFTTNNSAMTNKIIIKCEGHSGNRGSSLVCAGASTLMYALRCALTKTNCRPDVKIGDGMMEIRVKYSPRTSDMVLVTVAGFELLKDEYPEEVTIKTVTHSRREVW